MDDPIYAWPSWKFGMERADLFTKLHDQYNTFSFTLQDPDAFHHDVYELSTEANTEAEFHRLMADRRQQRLDQLNESLQSVAFEIIGNPKLIGTEQWSFAVQLFRTRSFDSLVRYFANYLPQDYYDRLADNDAASTISSYTDHSSLYAESTNASSVGDVDDAQFFPDRVEEKKPVPSRASMLRVDTSFKPTELPELPPSPRSMTMSSNTSAASSPTESHHHDYALHRPSPTRSLSFSGSESAIFGRDCLRLSERQGGREEAEEEEDEEEEETSQSDDYIISASSVSEQRSYVPADSTMQYSLDDHNTMDENFEEDLAAAQLPCDIFDAVIESIETDPLDTPTPKPERNATATSTTYLDSKPCSPTIRSIACSYREHPRNRSQRSDSPGNIRRSPEEAASRISKPLSDSIRTSRRQKGRRTGLD
ncbi:hypothetical protein ACRALDRAFT_1062346 [Sodiomyces alcalophilus JCM 7366]|uniref:uncharacterized protein n=1 Tax=Sodiomyces alcalophilus JCM 7366 TaxID=591952 RepID=UPI0039B66403